MSGGQEGRPRPTVDGGLSSVLSSLDVLECFATEEELGVTQIALRIGVAKSTAHRLLTTLAARGMVERDAESGRYRLGMRTFALGQLALERNRIRNRALPILHRLQQMTGSTIHLAVWEGSEVVYLERLLTESSSKAFASVARRLPAHCTASGKAIAAFSPVAAKATSTAGFAPMTGQSIPSASEYAKTLATVRKKGFATNVGEVLDGFNSVAAPVLAHDGSAKAAISIVSAQGPGARDLATPVRLVQQAATRLSRELCL